MNALSALQSGLARVLKYWQVMVVLYGVNLLAGLLLLFIPALHLVDPARLTAMQEAAQGIPVWMVQELAGLFPSIPGVPVDAAQSPALQELSSALWFWLAAGAAAPLLAWFTGSTLAGGVILVYSEAPLPFRWKRFFWGCWHWAGPFLTLSLFQTLFILVMLYAGILLAQTARVGEAGGDNGLAAVLFLLPLLVAFVAVAVLEITRIAAVQAGSRNLHRALGHALRFSFRRLLGLGSFYLLSGLLMLGIHAIFRLGLLAQLPLNFWPAVLFVQQVFILARLVVRGQRVAGTAAFLGAQVDQKQDDPAIATPLV